VAVKRRVRPRCRARGVPMADRIEMNMIHMAFEIALISNFVFVKAPLPDSGIAMLDA
jgi:hypothetical protein